MARCAAVLVLAAGVAGFSGGPLNNKRTVARPAAAYANGAPIISWRAATAADPLPQQRAATDGRTLYDLDELADGPPTIFESLVNASTTCASAPSCPRIALFTVSRWHVLRSQGGT
ncbi:hypothetical protein M885DRAFT_214673 [Pelagophyceae sp. CCMP2097]|nr:hypothetical protein M885DRAFT_214673 [Pelagophyceae sp. CCMP2097]